MWIKDIMAFLVSQIISIPFIKRPFQDLAHPQRAYSLEKAMNLKIPVSSNQDIGAWFLQPIGTSLPSLPKDSDEQFHPQSLSRDNGNFLIGPNQVVILYLHGNAETRSQYHRRALYVLFQKMGYFVLAIDYRGYGDSSWVSTTQTTMVQDAKAAYDWLDHNAHPDAKIFIWGHSLGMLFIRNLCRLSSSVLYSLGTGVTSKLSSEIHAPQRRFSGLILEAPFNSMSDEVKSFKLSRILPYIGIDVDHALQYADMSFDSVHWLKNVQDCRIFILHAEDDEVIPFHLATQMVQDLKSANVKVEFHAFSKEQKLGHDGIFKAETPETFSDIVVRFIESVQ